MIELLKLDNQKFICQISENHSNNYYNGDDTLRHEIEKLKLIIAHKDEIIQQKDEYIQVLKKMANINTHSELIEL